MALPVWAANLTLLETDHDALLARVENLKNEKYKAIDLATFSMESDEGALAIMSYLRKASIRGVKVRVLIDGLGVKINPLVLQEMQNQGAEIRIYHPKPSLLEMARKPYGSLRSLNQRMHDKLLIFDEQALITGSRNTGANYLSNLWSKEWRSDFQFRDKDVLVEGDTSIADAKAYFDKIWRSGEVSLLPALPKSDEAFDAAKLLDSTYAETESMVSQKRMRQKPVVADSGAVKFLVNNLPGKKHDRAIGKELLTLIAAANEEILIENPYVVLPKEMEDALLKARARGVKISIFTNGPKRSDSSLVGAAYHDQRAKMLENGVDMLEYDGPRLLHSKIFVFDNHTSFVGTFNLDPRSNSINSESGVLIVSEDFTRNLTDAIRRTRFLSASPKASDSCPTLFDKFASQIIRDQL